MSTPASALRNPDQKYCQSCGQVIPAAAGTCPKCGTTQSNGGKLSKTALVLIAFFLGGIGGHKFYVKKYVQGILYILFFWTLIPALIALIEFFIYVFTSESKLQARYPSVSALMALIPIALVVPMVAIIGILAAIAIPAYNDYTMRAKVAAATERARLGKAAVERYYADNQRLPQGSGEAGFMPPAAGVDRSRVEIGADGAVYVAFEETAARELAGKQFVYLPAVTEGRIVWRCEPGSVAPRYLPPDCRTPVR